MKIYTKTGDDGLTGILGNKRLRKDDARIEAYGTVDEPNAVLGVARAVVLDPSADALAARLQDELFDVGAALADPDPAGKFHGQIRDDHHVLDVASGDAEGLRELPEDLVPVVEVRPDHHMGVVELAGDQPPPIPPLGESGRLGSRAPQ